MPKTSTLPAAPQPRLPFPNTLLEVPAGGYVPFYYQEVDEDLQMLEVYIASPDGTRIPAPALEIRPQVNPTQPYPGLPGPP